MRQPARFILRRRLDQAVYPPVQDMLGAGLPQYVVENLYSNHYLLWFASMKRTRSVPERRDGGNPSLLRCTNSEARKLDMPMPCCTGRWQPTSGSPRDELIERRLLSE